MTWATARGRLFLVVINRTMSANEQPAVLQIAACNAATPRKMPVTRKEKLRNDELANDAADDKNNNKKKNVNRRSSYGHHGSKRRELAQHAHQRGSHASTHTLTSTQLQPPCTKRLLSYYIHWNRIYNLKVKKT